jgi:hypothetical protein
MVHWDDLRFLLLQGPDLLKRLSAQDLCLSLPLSVVGTAFAGLTRMNSGMRLVRFEGGESQTLARVPSSQVELMHFRNVTNNVVQDALNVWSEIWGELEGDVACGPAVAPEDDKGFTPSCGWPAFLEKMWVLRQNLAFLSRFSRH